MLCRCCKDCPRRELGCHEHCEEYAEFRKLKDEENKAMTADRKLNRDCSGLMYAKRVRSEQKRYNK